MTPKPRKAPPKKPPKKAAPIEVREKGQPRSFPTDKSFIDKFKEYIKLVPNNFIKVIVDKPFDNDKITKIINKLATLKPLTLGVEFLISTNTVEDKKYEIVGIDIKNMIDEFVTQLEITKESTISKDKLSKEMSEIYELSVNKVKVKSE